MPELPTLDESRSVSGIADRPSAADRRGFAASTIDQIPALLSRDALDVGGPLGVEDVFAVSQGQRPLHLGEAAARRMRASERSLLRLVADRRLIYGVTTGYGPLAGRGIAPDCAAELQHNLLLHLASGVGAPLSETHTRALMVVRAANLARGHSAIGQQVFQLLLDCINRGVVPVVPEMGTVGASGDLTPLAHVALVLVGEGEALVDGARLPGREALEQRGLSPVTLGHKEGIALVNGTSAMTGISAVNAVLARRAAVYGLRLGLMYGEVMGARSDAWDARFGRVRPHPGQQRVHRDLLAWSKDSTRLHRAEASPRRIPSVNEDGVTAEAPVPQDPYSLRCLPQIFGAVHDVLDFHEGVVATEIVSATDNPLVFADCDEVLHGGNFYGQHVAFAADAVANAVIKIAVHAERSLARICNPLLNGGLPPFLTGGTVGLHSGFMGAQVTSSALVAEMRTLATPASIQSIPTNNDNQDVVTMGTIAARKTAKLLDLCWQVLAIHAMALTQASELQGGEGFCDSSRRLAAAVRAVSAPLDRDRSLAAEISTVAAMAQSSTFNPRSSE